MTFFAILVGIAIISLAIMYFVKNFKTLANKTTDFLLMVLGAVSDGLEVLVKMIRE